MTHLVETEMERDAAISFGASSYLRAQLMLVSDAYQAVFCKDCAEFAVYDAATQWYKPCKLCADNTVFGRCTIPYALKLLIHLLAPMGINLSLEFLTSAEYADKIFRRDPAAIGGNLDDVAAQLVEADAAREDEDGEDDDAAYETNFSDVYD